MKWESSARKVLHFQFECGSNPSTSQRTPLHSSFNSARPVLTARWLASFNAFSIAHVPVLYMTHTCLLWYALSVRVCVCVCARRDVTQSVIVSQLPAEECRSDSVQEREKREAQEISNTNGQTDLCDCRSLIIPTQSFTAIISRGIDTSCKFAVYLLNLCFWIGNFLLQSNTA